MAAMCTIAIVAPVMAAASGKAPRPASSPQVYDLGETKKVNLSISTSFRTRNTRFFNELSDSMRSLRSGIADTQRAGATLSLWVGESGKIDSSRVECSDSSCYRIERALHDRLQTWRFTSSPPGKLLIVQDFSTGPTKSEGFFKRHRTKVLVGSALLVGLLIFL